MNWLPNRKVGAGASIGMPLGVIIVWGISAAGIDVPKEVGAAIGGLLVALISYFTSEREA